jgi:predicted outer membrane protein
MYRRQFLAGLLLATSPLAITHTVAQPAPAPGAIPAPMYLAMAAKGGMLLEETARDAYAKTQDPRVKKFSRAEVVEQVTLTDKLSASTPPGLMAGAAAGMPPGGLVGGLVAAPFMVAGAAAGAAGTLLGMGGQPVPMTSDAQKADMIARIQSTAAGPQNDALFVQTQLMGHHEAYAIHSNYAQNGDDPALRRVARGALPLLRLHIAQLTRMQGMAGGPQG